jgi:hypothetical protein
LERPQVYLQARALEQGASASATERWLNDLGALSGIARRARRTLESGLLQQLREEERARVEQAVERMRGAVQELLERYDLERGHAR